MERLMVLAGSLAKLITALIVLGWGLKAGWDLADGRSPVEKAPTMMMILLATFPPVGFILYYKYWEEKPPLSSACFTQAVLGVVSIVAFALINRYTPAMPAW